MIETENKSPAATHEDCIVKTETFEAIQNETDKTASVSNPELPALLHVLASVVVAVTALFAARCFRILCLMSPKSMT